GPARPGHAGFGGRALQIVDARPKAGHDGDTVSGSDLDLDVSADDAHVVAGDRFVGWVAQDLASADVEFCAVPRAGHLVPLDLTLGKRSFLVRAEIVERQ